MSRSRWRPGSRNDPTRTPEDLGPRVRSAWELSGWEQAVLTPPWLAICLVLVGWGPDHGLLERVLPFGLWALAHGPLYLGGRPLRNDARAVARASLAPPKEACVTQRARIEATTRHP